MTEDLQCRIMRHEGFQPFIYEDTLGNTTIGYGHCLNKNDCDAYAIGISQPAALQLLEQDIAKAKQSAATAFPWLLGLDDVRQEVIIEMVFQLGAAGVAKFKNMIAAVRMKDWDKAAQEMLNSAWHNETPSRCEELAGLMLTGDQPST